MLSDLRAFYEITGGGGGEVGSAVVAAEGDGVVVAFVLEAN